MRLIYDAALREVNTKLEILNNEFKMAHQYNPIEHITSRIKSPESIAKKLKHNEREVTMENLSSALSIPHNYEQSFKNLILNQELILSLFLGSSDWRSAFQGIQFRKGVEERAAAAKRIAEKYGLTYIPLQEKFILPHIHPQASHPETGCPPRHRSLL